MKYMRTLITMVVSGVVLAFAGSAVAQTVKPCVVTVVRIQGQARYSLGDNVWHPLLAGKVLHAGAIIQSAANATVDLVLSGNPVMTGAAPSPSTVPMAMGLATDPNVRGYVAYKPMVQQNVIRMFGNTVLAVDKLTQFNTGADTVSDSELDLRAGKIFMNVKKMSASSQFIIKIPNGVAGIRGSSGCLSADGSVQWYTGQIIISLINPKTSQPVTKIINGRFSFDPLTGQVEQATQNILRILRANGASLSSLYYEPVTAEGHRPLAEVYVSPTLSLNSQ